MIEYTKIKRMEKNKMREINFETLEAVIHYTFDKINSNALLKIGEFLSL